MGSILDYLLESALILGLLVGFYRVFMHNLPNFAFNRFFLLLSVFASVLIPLIHFGIPITTSTPEEEYGLANVLSEVTVYPENAKSALTYLIHSVEFYHIIYVVGLFTLLFRMYIGFLELEGLSNHLRWKTEDGSYVIYLPGNFDTFSFFNLIFINKSRFNEEQIHTILTHERAHVSYKHSYDIVLLEFLLLFQWFNPFVWILRRLLKEVHEFQVDRSVLSNGISRGRYKALLLEQATGNRLLPVNNFSKSLTKKRFSMMNITGPSRTIIRMAPLSLLFVFGVSVLFAVDKQLILIPSSLLSNEINNHELDNSYQTTPIETTKGKSNESMVYLSKDDKMTEAKRVYFLMDEMKPKEVTVKTIETKPKHQKTRGTNAIKATKDNDVFFIVEVMPEFPGGQLALRDWISKAVRYPQIAQKEGTSGKVYVNFVINKNGNVIDVKIARGVNVHLDKEALRVVSSMPKWIPGKQKGEAVKVSYTVPINFVLQ